MKPVTFPFTPGYPVQLIFTCPVSGKTFASESYSLIDNQGIGRNRQGEKYLKATVAVHTRCPHCQQLHTYRADELACPLSHP